MKTSPTLEKIAPALLAAQMEIGHASKNAKNPHFKNNYADLSAVIEAVKEPLNKHGIFYTQTLGEAKDGVFSVTTRLQHISGEWMEDTASSPIQKQDPQGVGSATTYLRRYSLAAICGITQEDDDGNKGSEKPAPSTSAQRDALNTLAGLSTEQAARINSALSYYKVLSVDQLNSHQAETIINKLSTQTK